MQKLTAEVPTETRTINKRVAVIVATVFVSSLLLWLGATRLENKPITVNPYPDQVSIDEVTLDLELRLNDQSGLGDQILMTNSDPVKVSREAAAFQEFKKEIAQATQDLDNSDAGVNGIVGRLTSFKACLSLTYFMARDFFTGGSEVDKIFLAEARKVDHATSKSVAITSQAIDRLYTALRMIEGSYTESHIAGPTRIWMATDMTEKVSDGTPAMDMRLLELTKAISVDSSLGSVTALLSATALTKTVNRSAWSLFGAMKKKAIKRMAVATFPAIADGPLPAGDIITMLLESGFLAWSFHEVYEAQGAIKNDLHRELTGVMAQNSKHIREWAMTVGNELMETAASSMPAPKVKTLAKAHIGK